MVTTNPVISDHYIYFFLSWKFEKPISSYVCIHYDALLLHRCQSIITTSMCIFYLHIYIPTVIQIHLELFSLVGKHLYTLAVYYELILKFIGANNIHHNEIMTYICTLLKDSYIYMCNYRQVKYLNTLGTSLQLLQLYCLSQLNFTLGIADGVENYISKEVPSM